jgi:hypothetical protein
MAKKRHSLGIAQQEDDWMVEDAMRCLMRAEEIRRDKKLMAKVAKMAKEKLLELSSVAAEASESE